MRHSRRGKPIVEVRSDDGSPVLIQRACRALAKSGKTTQAKEVMDSRDVMTASEYVVFDGFDDIEPIFSQEDCHEQTFGV